jgi:hypothetical protein
MTEIIYTVHWSAEDSEWVATCDKYTFISALSISPVAALAELIELIRDIDEPI